jgi:hypothetical protein
MRKPIISDTSRATERSRGLATTNRGYSPIVASSHLRAALWNERAANGVIDGVLSLRVYCLGMAHGKAHLSSPDPELRRLGRPWAGPLLLDRCIDVLNGGWRRRAQSSHDPRYRRRGAGMEQSGIRPRGDRHHVLRIGRLCLD